MIRLKHLFLFVFIGITNSVTSQTNVVINDLFDSLQPRIMYLTNMPAPKMKIAGKPTVKKISTPANVTNGVPIFFGEGHGLGLFTSYTSDEGLAMDGISFGKSTVCDSKGNIWFATQGGGVSRYDGKSFVTFTTSQGLANNSVSNIVEDKSGNLWFGTYGGGVSKYDGKSFTTYTTSHGLVDNDIRSIAEDKSGNLWFGTYSGVSKYDGKSFVSYTTAQGLTNNDVRSIAEDKSGDLWFGTNGGGVSKLVLNSTEGTDGYYFVTFTTRQGLVNNYIRSIAEDKSGNLWFGTSGGVSKYDGKSFVTFTTAQGLANNNVRSITEDKSGNIWFGTNGGVSKLIFNGEEEGGGYCFVNLTTAQGLTNNHVRSITEDKSGNLWFGTYGGGVSKYNGKSFVTFTITEGLTNNDVRSIAEDKSGNLWFGTYGGGVSKYDGKSFVTFTTGQGLTNNDVRSIIEDKRGNLWFGTYGGGVSKYDGKSFITFTTSQGLASNSVSSIIEDKNGNLWFGTNGKGVSKLVLNGTEGNARESFTTFTTAQGLANNSVLSIAEDKNGYLWFGTNGGGVSKLVLSDIEGYDPSEKFRTGSESFVNYTVEQGLANNTVLSIAEDKSGNLWFGTYGGGVSLLTVKNGNSEQPLFFNITTKNGLPDNGVAALRFDEQGSLMIGTNFGLYVLQKEEVEKVINAANNSMTLGKLSGRTYNQFYGYPLKDINTGQNNGAVHIDSRGLLWIGHGGNGVTRVDLNAIHKSKEAPNVVINKVSLKGESVCWYTMGNSEKGIVTSQTDSTVLTQQEIATYGKVLSKTERDTIQQRFAGVTFDGITKWYPLPENLVLPYQHNALTFEFNAIETGRNFMVNYQYALEDRHLSPPLLEGGGGGDIEWNPITKKHEATYNHLSEGKYTFLLKAQSPWGVWSEPIMFSFTVLPPWYRTWWAYTIYSLLTILFIWLLIRLQTKRLKQRQKELEIEVEVATKSIVEAHEELAEHHKEIQDSIQYAKRIQEAIMPSMQAMTSALKNGFILYEPKDVVAGDFFWMELQGDMVYYAAADCTGHGVPGAMVSVVCSNALTKALLEEGIKDVGKLLDRTREIVIERFSKSEDEVKDGMDISLCALNTKTNELRWAGANNPLWILRKEAEIIEEIKPNKQPIGKYAKEAPFTEHIIELNDGDTIYVFTDGYQDQFGGVKGKKFKPKQLKQLLLDNRNKSMDEQKEALLTAFFNWKMEVEQVDDVCMIGVRI